MSGGRSGATLRLPDGLSLSISPPGNRYYLRGRRGGLPLPRRPEVLSIPACLLQHFFVLLTSRRTAPVTTASNHTAWARRWIAMRSTNLTDAAGECEEAALNRWPCSLRDLQARTAGVTSVGAVPIFRSPPATKCDCSDGFETACGKLCC